jgi:hypothetical protein
LTLRGALNGEKILDDSVREYQAGLAAVRVHEEAVGRVGVLPVEDCGQAFDSAPQLGMRSDVFEPLAIDPDLTLRLAEPLEKLRTRARAHAPSSKSLRQPTRMSCLSVTITTPRDAAVFRHIGGSPGHCCLHLDDAAHSIDHTRELQQQTIAGGLHNAPAVGRNHRVNDFAAQHL